MDATISTIYVGTMIASGILFVLHKLEGRLKPFTATSDTPLYASDYDDRCSPENEWKCHFPGNIITHKPADLPIFCLLAIVYACIAYVIIRGIQKLVCNVMANRAKAASLCGIGTFTILWMLWAKFEVHHTIPYSKQDGDEHLNYGEVYVKRGGYFADKFSNFVFYVYLPVATIFLLSSVSRSC